MARRSLKIVLALAVVGGLGAAILWLRHTRPIDVRAIQAGEVRSVHLELWNAETLEEGHRTLAPEQAAALVAILKEGMPTKGHRCAPCVVVRLTLADGRATKFSLLPGHYGAYYEFRDDSGTYKVPRERMVEAMGKAGVRRDLLLSPENELQPARRPGE
ncbi:MAG: hypothetical protein ACAI43_10650 [Phycisphaerae bacterium]